MNPGATVADGSLLFAVPIAVAAGLVSFLSPCVLPLVPGYLGYVTGLSGIDLESRRRGRMVAGMALFVLGFTAVYVLIGATTGALGGLLIERSALLSRILGVITIGLGLVYIGIMPLLGGERRLDVRPAAGLAGAPLLGIVFGLSWTACTGPTLAAILALTLDDASATRGAVLATAYCLGLGVPFVVAGLAYRRMLGALGLVRRHRVLVTRLGGGMLIVVGLLLATGLWGDSMQRIQTWVLDFETVL